MTYRAGPVKAKFHYAIQLTSWSPILNLTSHSVPSGSIRPASRTDRSAQFMEALAVVATNPDTLLGNKTIIITRNVVFT